MAKSKKKTKLTKKIKKQTKKKFTLPYSNILKFGLPLLGLILFISIISKTGLGSELQKTWTLATTVQPETFTELYFENHTSLPNKIEPDKEYTFSFTLHNLEYKDMNYPYEIYVEENGKRQTINTSSVFVKDGGYKTISGTFTSTEPTGRVKIAANLIKKNQQIFFWANGTKQTEATTDQSIPTITPNAILLKAVPEAPAKKTKPKTVEPEVLVTEMYFDRSLALPLRVDQNQTISFAFTLHNTLKQDMVYPYEVYIEENGQRINIDNKQISIKQNEYQTVTETYTLTNHVDLAKVYVRLINDNRYIYFEMRGN